MATKSPVFYTPKFNAKTGMPNPIVTQEEFAAFVLWLMDATPSAKAERKNCYATISETGGATPEAKAKFIDCVVGVFLRGQIESGVLDADRSLLSDASARQRLQAIHSNISRFFSAVSKEIFEEQLKAIDLNAETVKALSKLYAQDREQLHEAVLLVAQKARSAPVKALVAWLENPRTRIALEAPRNKIDLPSQQEVKDMGRFAPLVSILMQDIAPSLRAERLGWILAYAKSGLLEQDFFGKPKPRDKEEAHALQSWVSLATAAGQKNASVSTQELAISLEKRLSFVAYNVKVSGRGKEATAEIEKKSNLFDNVFQKIAGPGLIDVVLHSPGLGYTVVFCTSEASLEFMRDQIPRHICGLLNTLALQSVAAGKIAETLRSIIVLAPAALEPNTQSSNRRVNGQAFFNLFEKSDALRDALCDALNPLGALAAVLKTGFPIDQIEQVQVHLAGHKEENWAAVRAAIKRAAPSRKNDEAIKRLSLMAHQGWESLGAAQFKSDLVVNGSATETTIYESAAIPLLHLVDFSGSCAKTLTAMRKNGLISKKTDDQVKNSLASCLSEIKTLKSVIETNADKDASRDHDSPLNDAMNRAIEFIEKAVRPGVSSKKTTAPQ